MSKIQRKFDEYCQYEHINPDGKNSGCRNKSELYYIFPLPVVTGRLTCRCRNHPLNRQLYDEFLISEDEARTLELLEL